MFWLALRKVLGQSTILSILSSCLCDKHIKEFGGNIVTNLIGKTVNGYLFETAMGSGAFGAVYKVTKYGVAYAAKVLSETYILKEFRSENNRIKRELDVLKNAKGDKLIKYCDDFFFQDEFGIKEYVIVMEFFDGITLSKFLENTHNEDTLKSVFLNILSGVKQLHTTRINSDGIIHRDLKPDNIMIDVNGNIKIIDYGLSKIIDYSSLTSTGSQIGSPLYMSPEQIKDSKHIDFRSDIYSLGIILYQMFTNMIPYQAQTIPELMLKIINDPIIPPKQYNPNLSERIENIIYKATAKEPFARFQNIQSFMDSFTKEKGSDEHYFEHRFYAWVYREKDVTQQFDSVNNTNIIYPIHVRNWVKGLHQYFLSKNFENVILDPSTQRLSYFAFANTKGLVDLEYAPDNGVISLEKLQNPIFRSEYIEAWRQTTENAPKLILPYHYISNTDYSIDKIDEWIKINVQLISESVDVVKDSQERYAMISIGLNHLVYQYEKILSYYVHADVDYFVVQVSDMKSLNEQSLKSYIDFMVKLQKHTTKPVIALKVPIALGLTLMAYGVHGFSLGLAGIDYFDEQYIKEEKDTFNLYSKYYFQQVMSFVTYPKKEPFVFEQLYDHLGNCSCKWCGNKSPLDIVSGDKTIQLHHWQLMEDEISILNSIPRENQLEYIKGRIDNAVETFDKIPKEIGTYKNNEYYKLLKNLQKIV